jgi:hypothetical protein
VSFNIAQFRSNALPKGGARPSLFEVMFPNISNLRTIAPQTVQLGDDLFKFRCTAATLPSSMMGAIPVAYMGRTIPLPGERTFDPWTISIMEDEDFKIRDFFEAWSNQMNSHVGNLAQSSDIMDTKVDDVIVKQLSRSGEIVRQYHFYGMFPIGVGDIMLNWREGNAIEMFDVRFAYDFWAPAGTFQADSTEIAPASYDVGDFGSSLSSRIGNV